MGGSKICVSPLLLPAVERCPGEQRLLDDQRLEGCKPVIVVVRAIVRLAEVGHTAELASEGHGPLVLGKVAMLG